MSFAAPPAAPTPRRRGPETPAIATTLTSLQHHRPYVPVQTPSTSTPSSSPFRGYRPTSVYGAPQTFQSPVTPQTAIQSSGPYNPQQWNSAAGGTRPYVPHGSYAGGQLQPGAQPAEQPRPVSPSDLAPPPPYSPRRPSQGQDTTSPTNQPGSQHVSPNTNSPASNALPSGPLTQSPVASVGIPHRTAALQQQSNPTSPPQTSYAFPPPPPSQGRQTRSSSRSRTERSQALFSLSALTSRSRSQQTPAYAESSQQAGARNTPPQGSPNMGPGEPRNLVGIGYPPAARRAASTGTIGLVSSHGSASSSPAPSNGNTPIPIPPPPPGPPPGSARSQSLNRPAGTQPPSRNFSSPFQVAPPTRRPPPSTNPAGFNLGPVPPTPANWVDDEANNPQHYEDQDPTRPADQSESAIRFSPESTLPVDSREEIHRRSPYQELVDERAERSRALDISAKGIRERRSESKSRAGKERAVESPVSDTSNNPWLGELGQVKPADLVLNGPGLARRAAVSKTTPRSGGRSAFSPSSAPGSAASAATPHSDVTTTPRLDSTWQRADGNTHSQPASATEPRTVLRRSRNDSFPLPLLSSVSAPPNTGIGANEYASASTDQPYNGIISSPQNEFSLSAIQRHNAFAAREAAATSDRERVQLFAEFIVAESRIRRTKYSSAVDAMGSEILELTRDLFRPYTKSRLSTVTPPTSASDRESSIGPMSARGSLNSAGLKQNPGSAKSEPESPAKSLTKIQTNTDGGWVGGYMPSLSPIASMMSECPDELSSRGRPASRWWEASQEGSSAAGGQTRGLERSKRESKYMGLPKELRESLQYDIADNSSGSTAGPHPPILYGPNEYPPEKIEPYDQSGNPHYQVSQFSPAPYTPDPRRLDVSRLVTLPPPYPRHYPAVNNNHPDLISMRAVVRSVSDFSEAEAIKEKFTASVEKARNEADDAAKKRKSLIRQDIQRQIEAGTMSYSEAGKVESTAQTKEDEQQKAQMQIEFDQFQQMVVTPVHSLLTARVAKATASFDELRSKLFVDAQERNPNSTQEQGDEQPELLEKLTLLKWIFEAREQLHREIYDLLSQRNDRYKAMVIMPYRLSGNEEKAKDAEGFFLKDNQDRKVTFEKETLKRVEEFMEIIEENVVRGVEIQLSAFWDIAPSLLTVTQKIPQRLDGFEIQIPADEYEENPSYHNHPMQYLYSLLLHSEKSTYQFIEAQTNLLCLLHEVKSGVTAANCRLMEMQRYIEGEDFAAVDAEMRDARNHEEARLTDDLKEKVKTVEDQWQEALGKELSDVKERVADWLVQEGGWEDQEE